MDKQPKQADQDISCQHASGVWFEERIEPYVDGMLSARERQLFESQMAHDPALAAEVEQARALLSDLQALPQYECPKRVTRNVVLKTGTSWIPSMGTGVALASSTAALALAVVIWGKLPTSTPAISDAELAAAKADMELALAYLDHVSDRASTTASAQWIEQGLAEPVSASLHQTQSLLGSTDKEFSG